MATAKKETAEQRKKRLAAAKRRRTMAANAKKRPARRRRATKKKGLLSDFTGAEGRAAFNSLASGGVGGALYKIFDENVVANDNKRLGYATIGSYFLAVMGKRPMVAAGSMGAAVYDFMNKTNMLADPFNTQMRRMDYADPLQNVPVMLSDNDMMSLSDNSFDLSDNDYGNASYYQPMWADTSTY